MINSIIYAINAALSAEFGSDYKIYMEEVNQDLRKSSFFISCVNSSRKLFSGKRYFNQNMFCIQYFPETENAYQECNQIMEKLYDCLECVILFDGEKNFYGTQMSGKVVENVLNFFVNYDFFTYKTGKEEAMEVIQVKNDVKDERINVESKEWFKHRSKESKENRFVVWIQIWEKATAYIKKIFFKKIPCRYFAWG